MERQVYRMAAFSVDNMGGNLAGVVLEADGLEDEEMLAIAREIGYSETAFVRKSEKADFKVRFFTIVEEVDLCGHATVATFNLLRDLGIISKGEYTQETRAGILNIKVYAHCIYMQQQAPTYYQQVPADEIRKCFTPWIEEFDQDMPIQIVSTGLKDILVLVKNVELLWALQPNLKAIEEISYKYDVVGIHVFCFDTIGDIDAHTRNFAPRYGINEESATGTSNGALSCYLMKYAKDKFDGEFIIEQGYCMQKPSRILTKVIDEEDRITQVYVGGSAYRI